MRIPELYRRRKPVYSFEFFPPRSEAGVRSLFRALDELRPLGPDFVSVTYPLDRSRRHLTVEIVARIGRELGIEAMAHLTCVDTSRDEITSVLRQLEAARIENVLALRGDFPVDQQTVVPRSDWFPHASDLADFIRASFDFAIGGAAHPEKHPEASDLETDLANLKRKADAGCAFLITQLFFSNADYFELVRRAHALGIEAPIVPGIMPVTNVAGIKRMTEMNGSLIPGDFLAELEAVESNPEAVEEIGVAYAQKQCRELIEKGAPGIHFYTLNRSPATREVLSHLRSL